MKISIFFELTKVPTILSFLSSNSYTMLNQFKFILVVHVVKWLNIFEYFTIEDLGHTFSYNPVYLSQLFKKETGMSLHDYIMKEKIEEAKKMLVSFHLPLSEIYSRLQFVDQSHFTKVFKKYTGTTPKQYKNNADF